MYQKLYMYIVYRYCYTKTGGNGLSHFIFPEAKSKHLKAHLLYLYIVDAFSNVISS